MKFILNNSKKNGKFTNPCWAKSKEQENGKKEKIEGDKKWKKKKNT